MRGMILAAGIGSRLGGLTENRPKCLVRLADGSCMLDKVVLKLSEVGVTEAIVNLFHLGDMIKNHVSKANYPIRISFSEESSLLGTGGGLKNVEHFFKNESFILYNSDIYYEGDLREMIASHKAQNPLATLGVMQRESSRALVFDDKNLLVGWENRDGQKVSSGGALDAGHDVTLRMGFSGIHVVDPKIFGFMSGFTGAFSIIEVYMAAILDGANVRGYDLGENYWLDMGTPERLQILNERLNQAVK